MSYETIKSKVVYEGIIIDVVNDTIVLPDGREAIREVVLHGGASAMLPVDEDGKLIFVRQYRHPAKKETLEIPAGTLEKGENPLECAARELEEETSYKSNKITFLTKMFSAIGFCTEILYIYLCEDLVQGKFNFDDDEFITLERYTPDESIEKIFSGDICDSKTIAAIFLYKEVLSKR